MIRTELFTPEYYFPRKIQKFEPTQLTENIDRQIIGKLLHEIEDLHIQSVDKSIQTLSDLVGVSNPDLLGMVYAGIGSAHTFHGNYEKAFCAFQTSIEYVSDDFSTAFVLSNISNLLHHLGYQNDALIMLDKALVLSQNNPEMEWQVRRRIALYNKYSNPKKAIELFMQAQVYYEKNNKLLRAARIRKHLACIYANNGDFSKAWIIYDQIHQYAQTHNIPDFSNEILIEEGWSRFKAGKIDDAIQLYSSLITREMPPYYKSLVLQNIAVVEYELEHYRSAILYHLQSLGLTTRYEMRNMMFEDYYKLGHCHNLIDEHGLSDHFFSLGYHELQKDMDMGIRIDGYRRKVLRHYVSFLEIHQSIPYVDIDSEIFKFTDNHSLKKIKEIFQRSLLQSHISNTLNSNELCKKLKIDVRTYFLYQKRLGIKRGTNAPLAHENRYFNQLIESYSSRTWKEANKDFEQKLFRHYKKKYQNNKTIIAKSLGVSYQQVFNKMSALIS